MRKRCHRKVRASAAPMLAVMLAVPEMEVNEQQAVVAFTGGWACEEHFDRLLDCRDLLALAALELMDKSSIAAVELAQVALANIKDRRAETGKFGASGDELSALQLLVEQSSDFWHRQPGTLFARCYDTLKERRRWQEAQRGSPSQRQA